MSEQQMIMDVFTRHTNKEDARKKNEKANMVIVALAVMMSLVTFFMGYEIGASEYEVPQTTERM